MKYTRGGGIKHNIINIKTTFNGQIKIRQRTACNEREKSLVGKSLECVQVIVKSNNIPSEHLVSQRS